MCVCVCSFPQSCLKGMDPLSMGFFWQEYWSGLPFPPQGDLPNPGIEPTSPLCLALAGRFFTTEPPREPKRERHKQLKNNNWRLQYSTSNVNRITKLKVHKKRFEQQYKLTRPNRHLLHTTYNNIMQIILNYMWKILHNRPYARP